MKHLFLILPLSACAHMESYSHDKMDSVYNSFVLGHDSDFRIDGNHNGAGSASSDALSDDSNGDGSDE